MTENTMTLLSSDPLKALTAFILEHPKWQAAFPGHEPRDIPGKCITYMNELDKPKQMRAIVDRAEQKIKAIVFFVVVPEAGELEVRHILCDDTTHFAQLVKYWAEAFPHFEIRAERKNAKRTVVYPTRFAYRFLKYHAA